MSTTIRHAEGEVFIEELPDGKRRISVTPKPGHFAIADSWTTRYPIDLVELMLEVHGAADLCFEIISDEDPALVQKSLRNDLFAYFKPVGFENRTILEFGCGAT